MYYEAFPPLSEKSVCLQEIMTVWNKAKACTYSSSSSSAVPQTSTDTSSPKDCTSEGEAFKDRKVDAPSTNITISERAQQRRTKREKENRFHGSATGVCDDQVAPHSKRQARHRSEGRFRPRSWSSGSSEAGSSSSGNQGEQTPSCKAVRIRHKSREVSSRNKRGRSGGGQVKLALKVIDKEERKNARGSISTTGGPPKQQQHYMKKGKRPLREIRKDANLAEAQELGGEANKKEYVEEPLWYTEPISEYFVPLSRSKLETKYRSKEDSSNDLAMSIDVDCLSERIQGICIANSCFQRAYLAAGTFVDGHFIEVSGEGDEDAPELNGFSSCPPPEDGQNLDDEHLSEFTHFYEVDLYQSILDPSASDAVQESRILNMIRQKSIERKHFEAGCVVLDGLELQGESAIKVDSLGASEADVSITQDMENIAQVWECCSSSSLEDLEGESCPGDSPVRLSPVLNSVPFNFRKLSGAFVGPHLQEASSSISALNSCFPLFELQYDSPSFSFPCDTLMEGQDNLDSSSCLDPQGNKQSRLLIWTKNSAFDETEHCSNLSTRTCSPWSHSEETRSDSEQISALADDSAQFGSDEVSCISLIPPLCLEEELLDFFQENSSHQQEETSVGTESNQPFNKKSKLESLCGIALEQDESKLYNAVVFSDVPNQQSDEYTSGIIKDIWMAIGDRDCVLTLGVKNTGEHLFPEEATGYQCSCLDKDVKSEIQKKAVQCSEYHLWDGQKEVQGLHKNKLSKMNDGDYTTPAKPWNCNSQDSTSFILGGVYGELKTLSGDREWAMIPPGDACGSLLQCAAATSSDMVTIAGADVFMNTSSCFAPGHKPLWRPLVSLGQNEQATKGTGDGLNKGFSVVFHEDLLGSCGGFRGEESGLDYPFSSFDLNNPFSQVLHVECSFEPEDMASFSPGFKPKSILCFDNEPFCPWLKSAQTSLDSQEGGSTLLPITEQEICVHCETAAVSVPCSHVQSSVLQQEESSREAESRKCAATDQIPKSSKSGKSLDVAQDMQEEAVMYDSSAERGGIPMLISSYHFQLKCRGRIGGPLQEQ
uniref:Zgc:158564 n=1 Tax=Cyprinus carpio TaxID=7962 RepID=A0A8C2L4Q9_CYPCA